MPAAPALLPELAGSTQPTAEVRSSVLDALGFVCDAHPDRIVVLVEADSTATYPADTALGLHRLGGMGAPERPSPPFLPIPLAIGRRLLDAAGWRGQTELRTVDRMAPASALLEIGQGLAATSVDTAVVLLGNASARSTDKAPGAWHAGAQAFNSAVARMLRHGDRAAMAAMTAEEAHEQVSDIRLNLAILAALSPSVDCAARTLAGIEVGGVHYVIATFGKGPS